MNDSFLNQIFLKNNNIVFDKKFRLKQIVNYIFHQNKLDFNEMLTLPADLRNILSEKYSVLDIKMIKKLDSKDNTSKFLFKLYDNNCVESVLLIDENQRYTFCISTQSGCRMGCTFCKTGEMGFIRNLSITEIISQILFLSSINNRIPGNKSYNIVFMGMGEPLDNFENLTEAIEILKNKEYFGLSLTRITISTCGIYDKIIPLLTKYPGLNLAVSLNSTIQEKREKIMPISKKYKLKDLLKTLNEVNRKFNKRITLEYVLLKDFNTGDDEIEGFRKINKKNYLINIIPCNNDEIKEQIIKKFIISLNNIGFKTTRRYRRGTDINAACGQLYWNILNK